MSDDNQDISPSKTTIDTVVSTSSLPSVIASVDEEKKEIDDTSATAAAKQTLKNLIQITDGGTDGIVAENEMTNSNHNDKVGKDIMEKHPIQKVVETLTDSVRDGFQTHVVPKVDELVSNTQYLFDTHVTPHVQGVQDHSSRAVQGLQENTVKVVQGVQEHSDRMIKGVQTTTVKAWQATEQSTKQFHSQHVVPHLERATTTTREFHQVHVQPKVDQVVHESTRVIHTTGSCLQRTITQTHQMMVDYRPWYWNTAPNLFGVGDHQIPPWYIILQEGTCRSFGQVIFCNNPVSGILFWLAMGLASPLTALCSVICVIMTNLTGLYLDLERTKLRQGYLAANSVLVGASLVNYFTFENNFFGGGWPIQLFLSVVLAPITLLVTLWLQHKVLVTISTPVLLLPFNMIMALVLLSANVWDSTVINSHQQEIIIVDLTEETMVVDANFGMEDGHPEGRYFGYQAVLNGIARIFLVDGVVPGAIILIGILMCSRILALAVVGGTFFSSLLSWTVFDVSTSYLNSGFVGFNPALAMAGIFFYLVPSWKLTILAVFWLILTMIVTSAVDVLLNVIHIPVAMSFGFCFALLPLLSLDLESVFGAAHTLLKRIPVADLSCPEEFLAKMAPLPLPSSKVMPNNENHDDNDDDVESGVVENETIDVQTESTPLLSSQVPMVGI